MRSINIFLSTTACCICIGVLILLFIELRLVSSYALWTLVIYGLIVPALVVVGVIKLFINSKNLNVLTGGSFFGTALLLFITCHFEVGNKASIIQSIIFTIIAIGYLVLELLFWFKYRTNPNPPDAQ